MLYDFLTLERGTDRPLWEQLYDQLKDAIRAGRLSPDEKAASIRQASAELSVSRTTVETAYARLCMEGYLEAQPQSGFVVRAVLPHPVASSVPKALPPKFDFTTSAVDPKGTDLQNWRKLVRAALADGNMVSSYGDPQGEAFLRQELSAYAFRARGVVSEPENIFIGAGVGPLLQILCPLLEDRPDVLMECAGFFQAERIFADYGFSVLSAKTEGEEELPLRFPEAESAVVTELPSLRPRIGPAVLSARRQELYLWAQGGDRRYVLEDDYNGELHYLTRPVPSFQGLSPTHTIYLGSFSKLLAPSVRIAYMVLPPQLAERARERASALNQTAGKTEQFALAEYIRQGLLEKHLRRLRRLYAKKSRILAGALDRVFGDSVSYTLRENSIFFLLAVKADCDAAELVRLAEKAGIACRPSPEKIQKEPRVLLGFSGIPAEKIAAGISLLGQAWREVMVK